LRTNKANSRPGYPTIPVFYYSTIPLRCRSCETNPICTRGEESVGQAPPCTWAGLRQTRRPRQKSPSRISTRVSGPISWIGSVEADFCRARQTNPIRPGRQAGRGTGRRRCAKQTQFGPAGRRAGSTRRENGRNEPNFGCGAGVGMTERAKQSQFAPADRNRWGKPHPTRGLNCVKRTQFGPGPQAGALKGKERGEQSQSRVGAARRAPCARSGGGRIGPPNPASYWGLSRWGPEAARACFERRT
jgi:hypothetical protein